jgi:hypothetical protein
LACVGWAARISRAGCASGTRVIAIECYAVERHDDYLAPMGIIRHVRVLIYVDDCETKGRDVAILEIHTGPFYLVPMVDGPIGVAYEIGGRIVRQSHVLPIIDTVR